MSFVVCLHTPLCWCSWCLVLKALEEDVLAHSKDVYQAVSLGQRLRAVCSGDDKELVQGRLDATQAGYLELQGRSRKKAEMLQQALANARLFGEDEVALMNWLSESHARLSQVSVQDYKTDVLEKQRAEQLVLSSTLQDSPPPSPSQA